jgi:hypothetical protein
MVEKNEQGVKEKEEEKHSVVVRGNIVKQG